MSLHIQIEDHELAEFQLILNRAVNCLEPSKWPAWMPAILEAVEGGWSG